MRRSTEPGTYYDAHDGDMPISLYQERFIVLGKSAKHPNASSGKG
jgi:hypothetical protein